MYQKEFEFKFQLNENSKKDLIKKIEQLKWSPKKDEEWDTYFKRDEEKIDENNLKKVLRIRKADKQTITFKRLSGEHETEIQNSAVVKNIFEELDYHPFLDIKKSRLSGFIEKDIEVNFDQIENLGAFLELAIVSNKKSEDEKKLEKLKESIKVLDLDKESLIKEGYVQLMIRKQKASSSAF